METARQVADRIDTLLALLKPVTPSYRRWYRVITEDNVLEVEPGAQWLVNAVAASVCTGDLGEPAPALGYLPHLLNAPYGDPPRPDDVFLKIKCGGRYTNGVALHSTHFQEFDPALLTFPIVKQTMLAFSQAFEPHHCQADFLSLWQDMKLSHYARSPVMTPCWMILLSPPLARRLTPPPDVVSERYDDGSLFMAVTTDRFDPDNAGHVAAAQRMFAVIDTLQEKLPPEQRRG